MKVIFRTSQDDFDYGQTLSIEIDGKEVFSVYDGEPEDNNLSRNFNDCFIIDDLLRKAYEAGKNGEPLEIEWVED